MFAYAAILDFSCVVCETETEIETAVFPQNRPKPNRPWKIQNRNNTRNYEQGTFLNLATSLYYFTTKLGVSCRLGNGWLAVLCIRFAHWNLKPKPVSDSHNRIRPELCIIVTIKADPFETGHWAIKTDVSVRFTKKSGFGSISVTVTSLIVQYSSQSRQPLTEYLHAMY